MLDYCRSRPAKRRLAPSSSLVGGYTATVSLDQFLSQRSVGKMAPSGSTEEPLFQPPEASKDLFQVGRFTENEKMSHGPSAVIVSSLRSDGDGESDNGHSGLSHAREDEKEDRTKMESAVQEAEKAKASPDLLPFRHECMSELESEAQRRFL